MMTSGLISAKYVEARIRRKKLPGGKWPCLPRQVLSERERAVLLALEAEADVAGDRVFAATMLTAMVGPPPVGLPKKVGNGWWSTVVPFAIADAGTGFVRLLVLEADTDPRLLLALEAANIPIRLFADQGALQEARSILEDARSCQPLVNARRVSEQQLLLSRHLRKALCLLPSRSYAWVSERLSLQDMRAVDFLTRDLREDSWMLLEEVALQRLVCLDDGPWSVVSQFLQHSSVDLVIVAAEPATLPILAIEFDGDSHDDLRRTSADGLKNNLLEDAGIPLLRVSHRDVRFKHWNNAMTSSEDRRAMSKYLDPIGHLIRNLVAERFQSLLRAQEVARQATERQMVKNKAARRRFGADYRELSMGEREIAMSSSEVQNCMEFWIAEDYVDQRVEEQLVEDRTLAGRLTQLRVDHRIVTEFMVRGDTKSGWCGSALIAVNGQQITYQFPRVKVNLRNVQEDRLRSIIEEYFIEDVASEVVQLLQVCAKD